MKTLILILALLASTFAAETPNPISPELRAKFWRARSEAIEANGIAQEKAAALKAAQQELVKACGNQELIAGTDGEPTCKPKDKVEPK